MFHSFNVYTMNEVADMCNLAPLISNRCKLPDRSLLHVNFTLDQLSSNHDNTDYQANLHENLDDHNSNEYKSCRYYFSNVPIFFYVQ